MSRIRHCVECPKCFTRYIIAFSPYGNGAYLRPALTGRWDEFILYCPCRRDGQVGRFRSTEEMACRVSNPAFERGYGTSAEIRSVGKSREHWSFDGSRYLNDWKSPDRRKSTS